MGGFIQHGKTVIPAEAIVSLQEVTEDVQTVGSGIAAGKLTIVRVKVMGGEVVALANKTIDEVVKGLKEAGCSNLIPIGAKQVVPVDAIASAVETEEELRTVKSGIHMGMHTHVRLQLVDGTKAVLQKTLKEFAAELAEIAGVKVVVIDGQAKVEDSE